MRRLSLIIAMFTCRICVATLSPFQLIQFNSDIQLQKGQLSFKLFSSEFGNWKLSLKDYLVDVELNDKYLTFIKNDTRIQYKQLIPSTLINLNNMRISSATILYVPHKNSFLHITSIEEQDDENVRSWSHIKLDCDGGSPSEYDVYKLDILRNCLTHGEIQIGHFNSNGIKRNVVDNEDFQLNELRNIELNFVDGLYSLNLQLKALTWLRAHIQGSSWIDLKRKLLFFRIRKAKIGLISIKKKLLKALLKIESKKIELRGDILIWRL